jgi:hypothetical protein
VDLAERALETARRRRAQRLTAGGAVAAVAAVVLGVVVAVQPFRTDADPVPSVVASLPSELPGPQGLPTLAEAPMAAASAAYVVDGRLVLVSADDGHAVVAEPDLAEPGAVGPVYGPAEAVTLSPDGATALVVYQWPPAVDALGRPVFLVDVAGGDARRLDVDAAFGSSGRWLQPQLAAWSPDSATVAVVGVRRGVTPQTWLVDARTGLPKGSLPYDSAGLSWGPEGLALAIDAYGSEWWLVPAGDLLAQGAAPGWDRLADDAVALALSADAPGSYLVADRGGYRLLSATGIDAELSRGDSPLAFVQAARDGYLVVTWPAGAEPGEPPPPAPLDVRFVGYDGALADLTRLPAGTSSASFAASLAGDG